MDYLPESRLSGSDKAVRDNELPGPVNTKDIKAGLKKVKKATSKLNHYLGVKDYLLEKDGVTLGFVRQELKYNKDLLDDKINPNGFTNISSKVGFDSMLMSVDRQLDIALSKALVGYGLIVDGFTLFDEMGDESSIVNMLYYLDDVSDVYKRTGELPDISKSRLGYLNKQAEEITDEDIGTDSIDRVINLYTRININDIYVNTKASISRKPVFQKDIKNITELANNILLLSDWYYSWFEISK